MSQIIRYLKLPFFFDPERLINDVHNITADWKLHYNTYDYTGNWSGIPLRSPGGSTQNMLAESTEGFADTEFMLQSAYIKQILEQIPAEKCSARLLKLAQGAVIKEHRDLELAFEQGEARLHIPVITHPDVEFFLDQHRLDMKPGECWYINANLPHSLANPSPVDRIHLVVDVLVNDALRELFNHPEITHKSVKEVAEDTTMLQKTIDELLLSNDPNMQALARKLQKDRQPEKDKGYS